MDTTTQVSKDEVLVSRDGPIVTLTFNRPEARNAMTWGMYQRLYEVCEEVDADDSIRVLVLKGAGGKAFVAGTDISQFTKFKGGEDGIRYEKDGDKRSGRIARVKKPVIAQIQGSAVGGGLAITAGADIRIATPDARFGVPTARTLGNTLSMKNYAMFVDLFGASRLKELIFTARLIGADEALAAGFVHEIVPADKIEARVKELAHQDRLARAAHAVVDQGSGAPHPGRAPAARWRRHRAQGLRQRRLQGRREGFRREAPAALDRQVIRGQGRNSFART